MDEFEDVPWDVAETTSVLRTWLAIPLNAFVLAVEYMWRLSRSGHELGFLWPVAVMVATKNLDDNPYLNSEFARVLGINLRRLNRMETALVQLLGYRLHCTAARSLAEDRDERQRRRRNGAAEQPARSVDGLPPDDSSRAVDSGQQGRRNVTYFSESNTRESTWRVSPAHDTSRRL